MTITGAGRAFSSGADLRAGFATTPAGEPDVGTALRERFNPVIAAVRDLPKPVLAAVNGPAVGIGCSLALACDLVVARESAYLLLAFVNIGLVPDGGATLLVPARAGLARAAEMALLGERIPARRALEWGLVTRVTADDGLRGGGRRARRAPRHGPHAGLRGHQAGAQRGAVRRDWTSSSRSRPPCSRSSAGSRDFAEGVRAFIEKRDARFSGE